jgi:hypothetical protein
MSAGFAYAQARIQARHGERAGGAVWARLDASKSLAQYLESARGTGLERWTRSLGARDSVDRIDSALRHSLRAYFREAATWVPAPWAPSVSRVAELIDLPLGEEALGEFVRRFRLLLPRAPSSERKALDALFALLAAHRARMLAAEEGEGETDGWELRRSLAGAITGHFRRFPEQPASVFSHLALIALDVERLRSKLVERTLSDSGSTEPWV